MKHDQRDFGPINSTRLDTNTVAGDLISQRRLKELLEYDPLTGQFTNRVTRSSRAKKGKRAGSPNGKGYRYIEVDGKRHREHRLIWLYVHGAWPPAEIDHRNGIKDDNRIANLRLATPSENRANTGPSRRNTSGKKGICWHKAARKWQAQIQFQRKHINLGFFASKEAAAAAYERAARELFGEFMRLA